MIQTAAQTTVKALLSENNGAKYHIMLFRPINANMHGRKTNGITCLMI